MRFQISTAYWLILRSGIIQSVPCTATILWSVVHPHLSSNYSWFIHQSSGKYQHRHLVAKEGGTWPEMEANFAYKCLFSYLYDLYHAVKFCDMGPTALLSSRQKSCDGFLSPSVVIDSANFRANGKHGPPMTTYILQIIVYCFSYFYSFKGPL
jgi:hypothetical protein